MKKALSALLAVCMAATLSTAFPANAATRPIVSADFESGLDGWSARGSGGVKVELTSDVSASGSKSAAVTGRTDSWNGISYALTDSAFQPGSEFLIKASIMQRDELAPVKFKATVQYDGSGMGGATYDTFATVDVAAGMWTTLAETYTIKEGSNPVLYFETDTSSCDFFIDNILITAPGGEVPPPDPVLPGDVDGSGTVDSSDVYALRDYLIGKNVREINVTNADMDQNSTLNASDLTLLKRRVLNPGKYTTTTTTATTVTTTTTTTVNPGPGGHADPKEYMAEVSKALTLNVPDNVKSGGSGKVTHFEYMSKKAGHNKGANVWLPEDYSASKKYNVLYMNHGIFGDEGSMTTGWSVTEMASNLIKSGEAEPFIIIFTQMYTDPNVTGSPSMMTGMNMDTMDHYDDFVFDLTESLMPYVEEHWSVYTGRDHTAIAGFSMGGRESIYCGLVCPDKFGYVCAASPAPGIVPASDNFIRNHLGSYNLERTRRLTDADLKFNSGDTPYILMIGGGTNDSVVGTFPKQYHQIFDSNGVPNVWLEVQGADHDNRVGTPMFYTFFRYMFKA
ncbi:MAG: carbohydrate binding domain-containing protein [Oscillospiraceae bacterium]|nr:carbohydrate binding domain-containing protein [Oscillospiraceae bacterium]